MASVTAFVNSNPVFATNTNKTYLASDASLISTIDEITTNITALQTHPSNGYDYLGVLNDGIYRHDQAGMSAERVSHWFINAPTSASITSQICTIGVAPNNTLYLFHNLSGYILRSNTFGKTFNINNTGLSANLTGSSSANTFEFLDQYVYVGNANSKGADRLSISSDIWSSMTGLADTTVIEIKADRTNNILYALTTDGIYKSTTYGNSWVNTLTSITAGYSLLVDPNNGIVYASAISGSVHSLLRSINQGSSWSACLTGSIYKFLTVNEENDTLYLYNESVTSIMFSSNSGDSFSSSASPNILTGLKVTKDSIPTFYAISLTGGLYSATSLASWTNTLTAGGDNLSEFITLALNKNTGDVFIGGYVLSASKTSPSIQKKLSTNSDWKTEIVNFREINNLIFDSDENMIYTIPGSGIFFKDSSAVDDYDYTQINTGLNSKIINGLDIQPGNYVLAATKTGLYRSDFAYVSWTASNYTSEVFCVQQDLNNLANVYIGTTNGVYKSSNSGSTFAQSGLTGHKIIAALFTTNGYLYVASAGIGLYRSIDNGMSWTLVYNEPNIKKLGRKNSSEFYISTYT